MVRSARGNYLTFGSSGLPWQQAEPCTHEIDRNP